jgi:thymidylate synthase (FAD)
MKISDIEVTPLHPERWGNDLDVVNAARVSFSKESTWENPGGIDAFDASKNVLSEKDIKLIFYLAKHKHTSPFNHSFLSFRIKAPIFVARQLVKHKFMPWNEVSRRYVDDEPEFYIPGIWRKRADNVKQGSSDEELVLRCLDPFSSDSSGLFETPYEVYETCLGLYQELLEQEVAPEQARMVLPQSMMTEWIWSGTLGAFLDMLKLRLDKHAQKETRDVAELILYYVSREFPISTKAML